MTSPRRTRTPSTLRPLPAVGEAGRIELLRVVLEIVVSAVRVRRLLRERPIGQVVEHLRRGATDDQPRELAVAVGRRLGRPVFRTLDPLPGDSRCLVRSLVLLSMLARRGVRSELVIGAKSDSRFQAHAWVELDGVLLLPALDYTPLTRL